MTDKIFSPLLIEFKRGSITDAGEFEGYCSTFNGSPDLVNDIVAPGAFTSALAAHKAAGTLPALLWNHDTGEPIGRWLDMQEDSKGLLGRGKLTLETRRGKEALALLKDQACSLSIGYIVAPNGSQTKAGIRTITQVARLIEVSILALPANPRARIHSVKIDSPKEFERFLRDAGLSAREAKRACAGGYSRFAREERSSIELLTEKVEALQSYIEERLP